MLIADLHIHSRYSMATSPALTPQLLDLWARKKGIGLLGTGDITHPLWRTELQEKLEIAQDGFFTVRTRHRLEGETAKPIGGVRFVLSGEVSCIYRKNGKVRKVHNLILFPGFEAAERFSEELEARGCNLGADGRPIVGVDSKALLEMALEASDEALFIPAHIWTPHFSLLGEKSGFDDIWECFEELTPHIFALETGLSSDPGMNRRLSMLDGFALVSNSDAHSPANLGREACIFRELEGYGALYDALKYPERKMLRGTIEFFPEEGKYYCDGHRSCGVCMLPEEAKDCRMVCPVCGKKLTPGVLHRIESLADRKEGADGADATPYWRTVPLPEVIAALLGQARPGVRARRIYEELLRQAGPELWILLEAPEQEIARVGGDELAAAVMRLRRGEIFVSPGYDGEYGKIRLFE